MSKREKKTDRKNDKKKTRPKLACIPKELIRGKNKTKSPVLGVLVSLLAWSLAR